MSSETAPGRGAATWRRPMAWTAAGSAVAGALRWGLLVGLARWLAPVEFGRLMGLLWGAELAAALATAGWSPAISRFTAEAVVEGRRREAVDLAVSLGRTALWVAGGIGLAWGGWLWLRGQGGAGDMAPVAAVLYYGLVVAAVHAQAWRQGCQNYAGAARLAVSGALLAAVGAGLGTWLAGVVGALLGVAAGTLPGVWVVARGLVRRGGAAGSFGSFGETGESSAAGDSPEDRASRLAAARAFAWVTAAGSGLASLVWLRGEVLLLEALGGGEAVGWYAAAVLYASLPVQLALLGRAALLPWLSGLRSGAERREGYMETTRFLAVLLLPLCLGSAAVAPVAVGLLWGEDYAEHWPLFALLAVGSLVQVFAVGGAYASSEGRHRFVSVMAAVGTIVLGLGSLVAIPVAGEWGAGAARLAAQWTMGLGGAWYLWREFRAALPWRALAVPAAAAAGMAAAGLWLAAQGVALWVLLAVLVAGLGVYAVAAGGWRRGDRGEVGA